MIPHPFGKQAFGKGELGDGNSVVPITTANVLGISYSTLGIAQGLPITYTLEVIYGASVPISYWVVPSKTRFAINNDITIPRPTNMVWNLPSSVGYDQSGISIIQGYTSVTWQYDVLLDADIGKLMAHYDPANPQVTIVYPNEFGVWVQKAAMMQPPVLGNRENIVHNGVSLTFSHIVPD